MTLPKMIIAATDFSENATRAVRQAAHLASAWKSKLLLVHVFNDSVWASLKAVYDLPGWNNIKPTERLEQRLVLLADQIAAEFDVTVETELLVGRASVQIGETIAKRQAGLLVVGEHGENWVSDVVLGGTALKVMEAARVPVLLVRRSQPALYSDILSAIDFSDTSERSADFALQAYPQAMHTLIHAWQIPFESSMRMGGAQEEDIERYRQREFKHANSVLEAILQRLQDASASTNLQALALHGSPEAVLFEQMRARGSDLIVIGKHGGSPAEERLLGSVTQNILYRAECDVLLGV